MPGNEAFLAPGVVISEQERGAQAFQPAGSTAGAMIGVAEKGPIGTYRLITSQAEFMRVYGNALDLGHLTRAAFNFFRTGGQRLYVVRTCHYTDITNPLTATADPASVTVTDGSEPANDVFEVSASTPGTWGNNLAVIVDNVDKIAHTFDLIVTQSYIVDGSTMTAVIERFNNVSVRDTDPDRFIEEVLAHPTRGSTNIVVKVLDEDHDPDEGTYPLTGGDNGIDGMTDDDYVGTPAAGNGLYALDKVNEVLGICHPGITSVDVIVEGLNYVLNNFNRAPRMSDVYYYDCPLGLTPQEAIEFVQDDVVNVTGYEGVYYPWVKVRNREEPSVPYMLGVMAQNDLRYGVWEAPAGFRFPLPITGLVHDVTETDQQVLNPLGINCIRTIRGGGRVPWGARTRKVHSKFRYLNVRRFVNVIKKTLYDGGQQFVFRRNKEKTWAQVEDSARRLLDFYYSLDAFGGGTPEQSYYAKCDKETNPPELVEQGIITCEIGIIPPKPAEFVHFSVLIYPEGTLPIGEGAEAAFGRG